MSVHSLRVRRCLVLVLACAFALGAVPAADAADSEPFHLTMSAAYQADRLNSPLADSLRLSLTHANRAVLGFDFRVAELPLMAPAQPSIHIVGGALTTRRAVAILASPGGAGTPFTLKVTPVVEMNAGFALHVPMAIIDPNAGAEFYAGYQGGMVVAGGKAQDFLRLKQVVFGFDRTQGLFQGSLAEMAYGHNESWGLDDASNRWAARFRIQTLLGPAGSPLPAARPVAGKPGTIPGPPMGSPLRIFVELGADTDGGVGPDAITAQVGLTLDAGSVLQRVMGTTR